MGRRWQAGRLLVTFAAIAVLCGTWAAYADPPFPSITGVTISPDPAHQDDDLTAVPEGWFDPQGDPEGYQYQWSKLVGGVFVDIPGETEATLNHGNFTKDDVIRVTVWPDDGKFIGEPRTDTITIQNEAPTVEIVSPLNGATVVAQSPVLITGTASDDGTVEKVVLRVNGGLWLNVDGTTEWSRLINIPLGMNEVQARAKDDDGVWGPIETVVFTLVLDPPSVGILSPADGSSTTGFNVLVVGDAHDNVAVAVVRVRVNGGVWVNANLEVHDNAYHWERFLPLVLGDNLIEARAQDNNGLWGPIEEITVTRVEPRPTVIITSPSDGFVTDDTGVTVTGSASDDEAVAVVRLRVNGGVWLNVEGTTVWSRFVPLVPGANLIEVRARDNDGLWGPIESISVTRQ